MSEPRNQTTIWWVWRNGVRAGVECCLAYDKEYPMYPDGGDPLTLGEPVFSGTVSQIRAWKPGADISFEHVRGRDD